jgi:hypothetical protein
VPERLVRSFEAIRVGVGDGARVMSAAVGYTIFQAEELSFVPRDEDDPRSVARLSDALAESRANVWRYPPGAQGKRHRDFGLRRPRRNIDRRPRRATPAP